jgi:hypothetical protein
MQGALIPEGRGQTTWGLKKIQSVPGVVAPAYNPRTQEEQIGELRVSGQPEKPKTRKLFSCSFGPEVPNEGRARREPPKLCGCEPRLTFFLYKLIVSVVCYSDEKLCLHITLCVCVREREREREKEREGERETVPVSMYLHFQESVCDRLYACHYLC